MLTSKGTLTDMCTVLSSQFKNVPQPSTNYPKNGKTHFEKTLIPNTLNYLTFKHQRYQQIEG